MSQLHFYAAEDELLPVLEAVESRGRLKYVLCGNFGHIDLKVFSAGLELPNLGKATSESAISSECFLVCEADVSITVRRLPEARGGERFCIDQLMNPDTVTLSPGGIWAQDILLYGRVGTASESRASQALMRRFASAIKKRFTRIKSFYVGPKALEMLNAGKRLTLAAQSPAEYDLRRD